MINNSIAINCSHDSSVCINVGGTYRIYELERITKERNFNLVNADRLKQIEVLQYVMKLIKEEYNIPYFHTCFFSEINNIKDELISIIQQVFQCSVLQSVDHHLSHAACGLYQSNFDECLIFSYDAGGKSIEGEIETFCIYHAIKSKGIIKKLASLPIDICGAYTMMAIPISEIHKTDAWSKYHTYAGKLMGLSAYGSFETTLQIKDIVDFFYKTTTIERLSDLGKKIGIDLSDINTVSGIDSSNLSMVSQLAFEQIALNAMMPFIKRYSYPVILTGGGALNVLLNQRLKDLITETDNSANQANMVFVPPNPNDCGLSFGMMAIHDKPQTQVKIQYNGVGILDIHRLLEYTERYGAEKISMDNLARFLIDGNIVGVIHGNSEVGARALGNRSILAYPALSEMKDKINKIKHREFFRPFAPCIREDNLQEYFHFNGESPYMSFAPKIREEFSERVPSVVHADGTCRVQSVTREQNIFLYSILTEVDRLKAIPILLNTSFNIKGKPILTTIEDAIEVLETTEIDAVLIEGYLFKKRKIND